MILLGRKIVAGYNAEPTLRFGVRRERVGPRGSFTAIGLWPLLVGVSGRTPVGTRWSRAKLEAERIVTRQHPEVEGILGDYFAFEAAVRDYDDAG